MITVCGHEQGMNDGCGVPPEVSQEKGATRATRDLCGKGRLGQGRPGPSHAVTCSRSTAPAPTPMLPPTQGKAEGRAAGIQLSGCSAGTVTCTGTQ